MSEVLRERLVGQGECLVGRGEVIGECLVG